MLNLLDTEEFNAAVSLASSLTENSLKAAMNYCRHIENKFDYNKCMISQGVDDYFVLRLAFASKDLSIGSVVYDKSSKISFLGELDIVKIDNAMNACKALNDNLPYGQCMTNQGISNDVVKCYAFWHKDLDPIDYRALIIRAEKAPIKLKLGIIIL